MNQAARSLNQTRSNKRRWTRQIRSDSGAATLPLQTSPSLHPPRTGRIRATWIVCDHSCSLKETRSFSLRHKIQFCSEELSKWEREHVFSCMWRPWFELESPQPFLSEKARRVCTWTKMCLTHNANKVRICCRVCCLVFLIRISVPLIFDPFNFHSRKSSTFTCLPQNLLKVQLEYQS